MENVEQHFEVIGILEEFNATLRLFEAKLPKFFDGLASQEGKWKGVNICKIDQSVSFFQNSSWICECCTKGSNNSYY